MLAHKSDGNTNLLLGKGLNILPFLGDHSQLLRGDCSLEGKNKHLDKLENHIEKL